METTNIRVLPPETAKRIAAGEVIDRPAAALRELLDNALDAGASSVTVELEGGGIEYLRVVDDGSGMEKDDLALSVLPHATSKIRELDDLLSLRTLGFRGEALASMAAVADIEIASATEDDRAWRLVAGPGKHVSMEPWRGSRGTAVTLRGLFSSFPARRQFLKRPSSEAAACRQVLLDKALAFPGVAFKLLSNGKPLLVLASGELSGRIIGTCAGNLPAGLFRELKASGPGFEARIVVGSPAVYRTDRKHLQVFINRRRVQEYGISQALEYAYRGALPGGAWPFAYAFVDVDPALADFNIHPAKKEVRLRNLDDIRGGLIGAIRGFLGSEARGISAGILLQGNALPPELFSDPADRVPSPPQAVFRRETARVPTDYHVRLENDHGAADTAAERSSWKAIADATAKARDNDAPSMRTRMAGTDSRRFTYLGQVLGVFLAAQLGDEFILVDQHAAHERILFDALMSGGCAAQELLVPIVHESESDAEDAYLKAHAEELEVLGFRLRREGGSWLLETAPAMLPASKTGALFELLRTRPDPDALLREVAARSACRAAVMDGDALDDAAAVSLIRQALDLPDPHCPHGRPIWIRMSKEDLYRAVRRIV